MTIEPHPAEYWEELDDGRLQCNTCPRHCCLHDGQRGFCFVRQRQGDRLILTTYGRSSGFCVDPIEKKPLNHFLPGSSVLSFGTAGCNLGCTFCQNWDISRCREMSRLAEHAPPAAIAAAAVRAGCDSVAYTYNEPTIFWEYAEDVAAAGHARGVRSVAVSAGWISPGPRERLFGAMDAANIDLKAFTDDFYRRHCQATLQPVLDTIEYVANDIPCWLELTTLLIPGENDSDAELDRMTAWVVDRLGPDVPMHFSAFHPAHRMADKIRTPATTLSRARDIARRNGVRYAYTGNVHDPDGASTWCHHCGALLIERDWYHLGAWHLTPDAHCESCGTPCAGVFAAAPGPGDGARRPVRIG